MTSIKYQAFEKACRILGVKKRLCIVGERRETFLHHSHAAPINVPYVEMRRDLIFKKEDIYGITCFVMHRKGVVPSHAVLYLFGGSFLTTAKKQDFLFAKDIAVNSDAEIWMPMYPLYPKALISDIVRSQLAVYRKMMDRYRADDIDFIGLSSGACICMYLLNYIQHENIHIPYPGSLILCSPIIELPPEKEQMKKMMELSRLDVLLPLEFFEPQGLIQHMIDHEKKEYRYLSRILYADMKGWPEIHLFIGTHECPFAFLEDLKKKCSQDGVTLDEHIGKGLCHCWMLQRNYPEALETREYISSLCRRD